MYRLFIPTLFLATQFLLPAYSALALSSTSSSCPCTLRGSVVDSVSGQPVPHALVKLTAPSPHAALTDSEGKFQFEGLPAGSATLQASKPGFLTQDPVVRWYPGSAEIQLAPDSPPVLLKLIPEGIIFGQVSDENGEPLEGFTITVFHRGPGHIGLALDLGPDMRHRPAITDDQGRFRIAGLRSGAYYLLARQPQAPSASASGKSPAPSGYSPMFYPAAADIASALPVKIPPGGTVQANFTLKREPYIRFSGTVSGYTPQERVFLTLQGPSGVPQELTFNNDTGSFQTNWVPLGVYAFIARADGFRQDGSSVSSFASLHVDATSSHSDLHLSLQPAANIPLVIHNPPGSNPDHPLSLPLALVSKDSGALGFNEAISPTSSQGVSSFGGGQLFFPRVAPGRYELLIVPSSGVSLYAESATWGSTDLFRYDLVLDSSAAVSPIEIVVRDDGATLNGTVSSPDALAPVQVVLLTNKRTRAQLVSVRSGGRFEVSGLAPGDYRVFAMDTSANVDYEDPAFLQKISSKIQEITLTPKQSASINLELATVQE